MSSQTAQNAQPPVAPVNQQKPGSTVVLKSLSILLGLFFIFIGAMKLTPHLSKDLHKDLVSAWLALSFFVRRRASQMTPSYERHDVVNEEREKDVRPTNESQMEVHSVQPHGAATHNQITKQIERTFASLDASTLPAYRQLLK